MYVKYVTLSTSRVGIPCRFAARDPSTLGAQCDVFHIHHSPPSSITTLQHYSIVQHLSNKETYQKKLLRQLGFAGTSVTIEGEDLTGRR